MTRVQRWLLFAAVLLPLLLYLRTLRFDFVYDDNFLVVNNPSVQNPSSLLHLFREGMWAFAGEGTLPYYRPLLVLLFALEHRLFGNDPMYWHFVNVLLHLATVVLVYWVGVLLFKHRSAALTAALFFGVFPVGSEVATWVAAGNESLLAILLLLAFGAYLKAEISEAATRWRVFSWLMLLAAMLVKELAIVFPALIFYYAFRTFNGTVRSKLLHAVRVTVPYAVAVIAVLVVRARIVGPALVNGSLTARIANFSALARFTLSKLVWPTGLSVFYPAVHPSIARSIFAIVAVGLALLLTWRNIRLTLLVLWAVLFVAPAINIANPNLMLQTRYLYLPAVAFCWLIGWGLGWLPSYSLTARAAIIGLTALYAGVSYASSGHWANNLTLFERAVQISPQSANALFNYSGALHEHNRTEDALVYVTRAHQLDPQLWLYVYQISKYQLILRHPQQAEAAIEEASHLAVPKPSSQYDSTLKMRARILLTEGKLAEAEQVIREGLADKPTDEELQHDLASCLSRQHMAAIAK